LCGPGADDRARRLVLQVPGRRSPPLSTLIAMTLPDRNRIRSDGFGPCGAKGGRPQMTFEQRREAALKLSADAHISRWDREPPLWRLLWRLSVRIPPPHFMPFWSLALFFGAYFGFVWGAFMWFVGWRGTGAPYSIALVTPLLMGAVSGVATAALNLRKPRECNLPLWRDI
jgi:hypothetical protein